MDRPAVPRVNGVTFMQGGPRMRINATTSDYAHASDSDLVRSCLDGDQRAWDEMVERYGRLVQSIARRQGLGATDAEDVVQQVFAAAHAKLGSLRDPSRLSAWLFSITLR